MAISPSLAQHLLDAADNSSTAAATALQYRDIAFTFRELLTDTERLALTLGHKSQPVIESGNSLHLARHAYACSYKNRAFWPVDRNHPDLPIKSLKPDVALIISTSGSEGQPRQVLLGNSQLDAAAAASNRLLPLNPGDIWLNCLPLYHIGAQAILWRCARAAATMLLHDGFIATAVAMDLKKQPVTHISLVPAMLAQLLELGVKPPPSLRIALIGGAALSRPLYDKALAANWPLRPSYGMSETAGQLATYLPADSPWHEGLVGHPMSGHEIHIDNNGRIRIRGPQVMIGYLNGDGIDADGWLTTGDLGKTDADGRLSITGRADDMLISGGRNIHPQEVESCLAACTGVRDVAVTGLHDPVWGQMITALVVGDIEPNVLLSYARSRLHSAAQPRKIIFIDSLPRNATGKLDRAALRRIAQETPA